MIREYINSTLQSKNAVMFITSIMFMAGILSYFNDCEIFVSAVLTILGVILIFRRKLSVKYVIFWIIIFYLGFFNSYFRIDTRDQLYDIAPADTKITGQIVSIPNTTEDKTSFFFDVFQAGDVKIKAKSYVTLYNEEKINADFNIGDNLIIDAKVRRPFKAGNPSQFDYGKYLQNFNAFTTVYADYKDCRTIDSQLSFRWNFLRRLNKVRDGILKSHAKYLQSPNLEILGGVVFGDDAVAPPDYIKTKYLTNLT